MQPSTRSRYAILAPVQLPRHRMQERRAASFAQIAAVQHYRLPYFEPLFAGLRRALLPMSVRGPGGGHRPAQAGAFVTIADIVKPVDESLRVTRCGGSTPPSRPAAE